MYAYRDLLARVNFTMGVGGTFDVIAGYTKRAPVWMQQIGMEWFYRFCRNRAVCGNATWLAIQNSSHW